MSQLTSRFAVLVAVLLVAAAGCTPAVAPAAPTAAIPTSAPPTAAPTASPTAAVKPTAAAPAPTGATVAPTAAAKPAASEADLAAGRALISQKGCGACHTVPGIQGATGSVGPNLGGVASRTRIAGGVVDNTGPDDLKRWIMKPSALKPGTGMPDLGLTDDEANKIVAFLETAR